MNTYANPCKQVAPLCIDNMTNKGHTQFLSQNAEGQEQQEHACRHGYDKENNISYAKSEQGFVIGFAVGFFASISEEREKLHKFD